MYKNIFEGKSHDDSIITSVACVIGSSVNKHYVIDPSVNMTFIIKSIMENLFKI
jgi:hypothetical protein